MARLFRDRIEAVGADGLDAGCGFDVIRLAALSAERLDCDQLDWASTSEARDLADLVDRLGARFGLHRVTKLCVADSHRPERATAAAPAGDRVARSTKPAAVPDGAGRPGDDRSMVLPERPIRLLERPEPIEAIAAVPDGPPSRFKWRRITHHVAAIEGPERIGPDWWRQDGSSQALSSQLFSSQVFSSQACPSQVCPSHPSSRTRDYFRAEDTEGRRFWLYREGFYGERPAPRWFLHGFFA